MTNHRNTGAVVCFATQGTGSLDEQRIVELLADLEPQRLPFDRSRKAAAMLELARRIRRERPQIVVMEGTGIGGGIVVLAVDLLLRVPYVVSTGDAVGPYLATRGRVVGFAGSLYERLLLRRSAGVIGWTPYIAGRALTLGARRVMTAPGWARTHPAEDARERGRARLGLPADALVFGLVGSLTLTRSVDYTYGLELVRALKRTTRPDLRVCVIGDGSGLERLRREAGSELGRRVILPGRVPADEVVDLLASFDVASLPQSTDGVGSFRYSTKLPEYLAAGLPVVTGQIPAAYDLDDGWLWRLPGDAPWDERYIHALTHLMETVARRDIDSRTEAARAASPQFDGPRQRARVTAFVADVLRRI